MARILTRRGRFDEALAALRLADIERLKGYWRGSLLLAVGETLSAGGQKDRALATYRALLADESVQSNHRKAAGEAIKGLEARK